MKLIIQDQVHYKLKTPVFKQYQTHLHPVEILERNEGIPKVWIQRMRRTWRTRWVQRIWRIRI